MHYIYGPVMHISSISLLIKRTNKTVSKTLYKLGVEFQMCNGALHGLLAVTVWDDYDPHETGTYQLS